MNRRIFITGTDTGVGKTIVTSALFAALHHQGIRCLPVKPIQTGTSSGDDDLAECYSMAGIPLPDHAPRYYQFPLPASPHIAAKMAGESVSVEFLVDKINELAASQDILLMEGAGGLLTPINTEQTMLDLIKATHSEVVVVTRSGLGTLNHTSLTLNMLKQAGIIPVAIVVNDTVKVASPTDKLIRDDNLVQIDRMAAPVPVIHYPHHQPINSTDILNLGARLAGQLVR